MVVIRTVVAVALASSALVACGGADGDDSSTAPATDGTISDTVPANTEPASTSTTTTISPTTTSSTTTTTTATTTTTTAAPTTTTTTTTTTTPAPAAPESARYRVTLVMEWSPFTHPATLPPGWHSSPAVLAAHAQPGGLAPIGGAATPGVESMAETGKTALLVDELAANEAVAEFATGQRIDGAGSDVLEVGATQTNRLLSLVTMLAPSPDWFVGVVDIPVFEAGAWLERAELDLIAWDAGTDSGPGFTSDDVDTQPREPISPPRDADYLAAAAEGRFGYVVIERVG